MKPKVAVFDFSSCEGCELQIANLEESLIEITKLADFVEYRELMKEQASDYDIAIVDGSISRPMDEERLKQIRANAKVLIALGACAHLGCVQRMGNRFSAEENKGEVYSEARPEDIADGNRFFERPRHKALEEVVKVDYTIPGCPIDKVEFVNVLVAILTGKKPPIPDYPVCVECKKRENVCLFTLGGFCMGPVARAGCNAICPTYGAECEACRGYVSHPHQREQEEALVKYGLTLEEIMNRKTMFTSRFMERKEGD